MSSLTKFELKLFKGEPHLSGKNDKSKDLGKCGECSLASMQLVTMELKVHVSSRSEVEVQATMKDVALINCLQEKRKRNIQARVDQVKARKIKKRMKKGTRRMPGF